MASNASATGEALEIYYPDNYDISKGQTCMKANKNNNGTLWGKMEIPSDNKRKYKWTFRITNPGVGGGGTPRGYKMAIGIASGFNIMKDTKSVFYEQNTSNYHIRLQDGKLLKKNKPYGDISEAQGSTVDNPANKGDTNSSTFSPQANDIMTMELDLMHRQIIFVYYRNSPLPIAEGIINGIDIDDKLTYKLAIYCGQKNSELELVNFKEYVNDIQDEKETDAYNDMKQKNEKLQRKLDTAKMRIKALESQSQNDQKEVEPLNDSMPKAEKIQRQESETTLEFNELFKEWQAADKEIKSLKEQLDGRDLDITQLEDNIKQLQEKIKILEGNDKQ